MVHNLICDALLPLAVEPVGVIHHTIPHRTEVMGFMTILHGDDRFYNNIFIQKWPSEDYVIHNDHDPDALLRKQACRHTHFR